MSERSPAIKWNSPSITHLVWKINDMVYGQKKKKKKTEFRDVEKIGNLSKKTSAACDRC